VGAHTSFGTYEPDRCVAGANALAPDLMTAEERLTEVAQILAAGLMRPAPTGIHERCRPRRLSTGLLA
jgi:hypothetical protein